MLGEHVSLLKEIEVRAKWDGAFTQEWATIKGALLCEGGLEGFPGDNLIQKLNAWAESQGLRMDLDFKFEGLSADIQAITFSKSQAVDDAAASQAGAAEERLSPESGAVVAGAGAKEAGFRIECVVHEDFDWASVASAEDEEDGACAALSREADCAVTGGIGEPSPPPEIVNAGEGGAHPEKARPTIPDAPEAAASPNARNAEAEEVNPEGAPEAVLASCPRQEAAPLESSVAPGTLNIPQAGPLPSLPAGRMVDAPQKDAEKLEFRGAPRADGLVAAKSTQGAPRVGQSLSRMLESRLKPRLKRPKHPGESPFDRTAMWSRIHLGATGFSDKAPHWLKVWIHEITSRSGRALMQARLLEARRRAGRARRVILEWTGRLLRYVPVKRWRLSAQTAGNSGDPGAWEGERLMISVSRRSMPPAAGNVADAGVKGDGGNLATPVVCQSPLSPEVGKSEATGGAEAMISNFCDASPPQDTASVENASVRDDAASSPTPDTPQLILPLEAATTEDAGTKQDGVDAISESSESGPSPDGETVDEGGVADTGVRVQADGTAASEAEPAGGEAKSNEVKRNEGRRGRTGNKPPKRPSARSRKAGAAGVKVARKLTAPGLKVRSSKPVAKARTARTRAAQKAKI